MVLLLIFSLFPFRITNNHKRRIKVYDLTQSIQKVHLHHSIENRRNARNDLGFINVLFWNYLNLDIKKCFREEGN